MVDGDSGVFLYVLPRPGGRGQKGGIFGSCLPIPVPSLGIYQPDGVYLPFLPQRAFHRADDWVWDEDSDRLEAPDEKMDVRVCGAGGGAICYVLSGAFGHGDRPDVCEEFLEMV